MIDGYSIHVTAHGLQCDIVKLKKTEKERKIMLNSNLIEE